MKYKCTIVIFKSFESWDFAFFCQNLSSIWWSRSYMLLLLLKTAALTFWWLKIAEYSFERSRRSRTRVVLDWQISYAMNTPRRSEKAGKDEREGDLRWRTDWIWSSESMSCGGFSPAVRITSLCAAAQHHILTHNVLTTLALAVLCSAFPFFGYAMLSETANMFHMERNYCAGKEPRRNCS